MKLNKINSIPEIVKILESNSDKHPLVEEDIKEEPIEEPVEVEQPIEQPVPEVKPEEVKEEQPDEELITHSLDMNVKDMIQGFWDHIGQMKSFLLMLEEEKCSCDKEAIKVIIDSLIDDANVGVGMLTKVSELLDIEKANLVDAGVEKAETLISEPASVDLKAE